jgi:hypothetical protein
MRILPEGRKKAENPLSASIAQKMDCDQLTWNTWPSRCKGAVKRQVEGEAMEVHRVESR